MGTTVPQFDSETSKDELNRKIISVFDDIFELKTLAGHLSDDEQLLSEDENSKRFKMHLRHLNRVIRNLDFDYAYLTSYLSKHCS